MKREDISHAVGNIDSAYVQEIYDAPTAKRKRPVWLKWGAIAACLCLILGVTIPMLTDEPPAPQPEEYPPTIDEGPAGVGTQDEVEFVEFNGAKYVVCGNGENLILQECGLPTELTSDLAGAHVSYLGIDNNRYFPIEKSDSSEENDIELFEFAPMPNENVYILCKSGEYYAAIRKDSNGYHGLPDIERSKEPDMAPSNTIVPGFDLSEPDEPAE